MSLNELEKLLTKEGLKSDEGAERTDFIDTGIPHLNYILSNSPYGGLTQGKITEISGESMSGKTMLLSQIFISAQRAGGYSSLWDHEEAYNQSLSVKQGLDISVSKWLYRKGKAFETSLVEAVKQGRLIRGSNLIAPTTPVVAGFDSFAAMIPLSQLESKVNGKVVEKDMDAYTMNDTTAQARVASTVLKVYNRRAGENNITSVFLNQLAATMDMYGPETKSKGGKSLPFYADSRIFIKGTEIKEKGVLLGKDMTITVIKNRNRPPGDNIKIRFTFDRTTGAGHFDILGSYVDFLKGEGVIETSGAWIKWNGETFQGIQKVKDHYAALPDGLEQLKKLHQEFLDKRVAEIAA